MGLIFMGVGALSLVIGAIFFFRSRRFLRDAVSGQGTVTDMVASSGSEGGLVYHPVIQFTTPEGQQVTFQDLVGQNPPKYRPGDMVELKYPPGRPDKARIPSWFRLWFVASLMLLFGVVFGGTGAGLFLTGAGDDGAFSADPADESPGAFPSGVPAVIPSNIPGILPTGLPDTNRVLVIQDGAGGTPSIVEATCESISQPSKKVREVRLSFDGGTLSFRVKPYTGPGGYPVNTTASVESSVLKGDGDLSGAVVFDATEKAGAVNLVRGDRAVSGSWSCADVEVEKG